MFLKFYKILNIRHIFVSFLSVSYSLKKNSGSGGGVTNLKDQARTCTELVYAISRLIRFINRLMF